MDKRWPSHYDEILLGAAAGLAASLVRNSLEFLAVAVLPYYRSCARLAGAIVFAPECLMRGDVAAYICALEIDFLVGIVVGVVAVQILRRWGLDHYRIKGAIGGALTWLLFFVYLSRPLSRLEPTGCFLESQISLAIHLIFGLTLTYTAVALDRRAGKRDHSPY